MKVSATQILAIGAVGIAGFVVVRVVSGVGGALGSAGEAVANAAEKLNPFKAGKVVDKPFSDTMPGKRVSKGVKTSSLEAALEAGVS